MRSAVLGKSRPGAFYMPFQLRHHVRRLVARSAFSCQPCQPASQPASHPISKAYEQLEGWQVEQGSSSRRPAALTQAAAGTSSLGSGDLHPARAVRSASFWHSS